MHELVYSTPLLHILLLRMHTVLCDTVHLWGTRTSKFLTPICWEFCPPEPIWGENAPDYRGSFQRLPCRSLPAPKAARQPAGTTVSPFWGSGVKPPCRTERMGRVLRP